MKLFLSDTRPSTPPDPARYTGAVWTDALADGAPPGRVHAARISFAPGSCTAWHTHPFGQLLLAISGTGLVQKMGEPAIRLRSGDSVAIEPGERHWHGAAPDNTFVHIAVQGADDDGRMADWAELVDEADYRAAASTAMSKAWDGR